MLRKEADPSSTLVRYLEALPLTAAQRDQALELVADIHLANAPLDGEYPVRSETQLQWKRRRERELADVAQGEPHGEDLVRRVEDAAALEQALCILTREERACLVLSMSSSCGVIAMALRVSERTVRARIHAAKRKLEAYRETVQQRGAE